MNRRLAAMLGAVLAVVLLVAAVVLYRWYAETPPPSPESLGPGVERVVLRGSIPSLGGGLNLGLIGISSDEAVVGVYNPLTKSPESHHVRPGDRFEVAGRRFEVTRVSGWRDWVQLEVRWDEPR